MGCHHLTLAEQETVTLWDNELDTASIYSHDRRIVRKLQSLSEKYPEQFILKERGPQHSVTYEIPKKCIGIRPPYSEKRRKAQKDNARTAGLPFDTGIREEAAI